MSEAEENVEIYGTLLEPYDEDNVPKKKAFTIEDQVATDAQGRRRFHGAFTGGFSAGFFNTVGSLEGWRPTEFKSSRAEKAYRKLQKPEDFMDDEDMGEFGIAPKVVRATSDYDNTVKRKRNIDTTNTAIPGIPVLQALQPTKDTIGIKLLKQMGWKPGQGVGPRLTKSEKIKANRENKKNIGKVYGCEIPEQLQKQIESDEELSEDDPDITFAPDDYDLFIYKPKDNTFGMGYSGLDKKPILSSHITLFPCPQFKMRDGNKNVSISGQAFGVGAFENEDEDIYCRDDMSKYDFELEAASSKKKYKPKKEIKSNEVILDGFTIAKNSIVAKKTYPPPILPKNFIPKHGVRISRFEALPETHPFYNNDRLKTRGRHDLTAADRSKILNSENVVVKPTTSLSTVLTSNEETESLKSKIEKLTSTLPSTSTNSFKPFIAYPDKQIRYEQYLELEERDKLVDLQPASMCDWEKEREKSEFEQASRLFKPVQGLIFDRFVQSSTPEDEANPLKPVTKSVYTHGDEEMREAAKNKKFGQSTRRIMPWKPNKLLCKRFNVPEPEDSGCSATLTSKKKNKFSVFDYFEAYQQNNPLKEGPEPFKQKIEESKSTITSSPVDDLTSKNTISKSSDNKEKENVSIADLDEKLTNISATDISSTIDIDKPVLNINTNIDITLHSVNKFDKIEDKSSGNNETDSVSTSKTKTDDTDITSKPSASMDNTTSETNLSINLISKDSGSSTSKINLPKPNIISVPTDPKEKIDLFKAIFLSSSESESEAEETNSVILQAEKISEMKKIILEENIVKLIPEKPKTNKGIFADLNWSEVNKQKPEKSVTKPEEKEEKCDDNVYGPKLPNPNLKIESNWKPTFQKVSHKNEHVKKEESSDEDEWLELDIMQKSTQKKHKKHKSEKKHEKSHKKHKSKHKKKKHSSKRK